MYANHVLSVSDLMDDLNQTNQTSTPLPLPGVNTSQLTVAAHDDLVNTLMTFGNRLSPRHSEALKAILTYYTDIASGDRQGRYAFPLGTSLGKTQSVVSWCATVHSMGLDYTALICQEQIETLNDLYKDLLAKGIPADAVGIVHRDESEKYSLSTGNPREYRFLLVTHEMIKSSRDVDKYMSLGFEDFGEQRAVCIWDESLIKSDSLHQRGDHLSASLKYIDDIATGEFSERRLDGALSDALSYLKESLNQITKRHRALRQSGKTASRTIDLEELDSDTIKSWCKEIRRLDVPDNVKRTLVGFLNNSQEKVRLVRLGKGASSEGIVSYKLRIPRGLTNIVVLDASAAIRHLMDKDRTLTIVDGYEDVKTFENFEVVQIKTKGGNTFVRNIRKNNALIREVVNDVTSGWLPAEAACLIACVKSRPGRNGPQEKIRTALEDAGVDLDATVTVREHGPGGRAFWTERPKFEFVTWGQERATNKYRHCSHIIAAGVLRRDELELSAASSGQREDLMHDDVTNRRDIEITQTSEQFYRLQQLLGRGTSRKTIHGSASPAWAKVYDQADFSPFIEKGMPGVNWTCQESGVYVRPANKGKRTNTKTSKLSTAILEWLKTASGERISVRNLKLALGATSEHPKTFTRALERALDATEAWNRADRSVVRC